MQCGAALVPCISELPAQLAKGFSSKHSIVASFVYLTDFRSGLQMRVMPNTPCLIGQAASAYVLGTHATDDDAQKTYALMSSVGERIFLHQLFEA